MQISVQGSSEGPNQLPRMRRHDSSFTESSEELLDFWRAHFEELEGGTTVQRRQTHQSVVLPDFCEIPTPWHMALRANKNHKSTTVPTELAHFPALMTKVYYPAILKQCLHVAEPVCHKGVHAFKEKGDPFVADHHRALTISSAFYKLLRSLTQTDLNLEEKVLVRLPYPNFHLEELDLFCKPSSFIEVSVWLLNVVEFLADFVDRADDEAVFVDGHHYTLNPVAVGGQLFLGFLELESQALPEGTSGSSQPASNEVSCPVVAPNATSYPTLEGSVGPECGPVWCHQYHPCLTWVLYWQLSVGVFLVGAPQFSMSTKQEPFLG
eukprot:s4909_g2.t1